MSKKNANQSSSTRSREITHIILRRIISGVYPAGTLLPTERKLAEEFHVARTIIREALKRVEASHLITIRHGSGALVEDVEAVGGIELADYLMVRDDGSIDNRFLKDVGQFHEGIHIWLVRLTAARITPDEIEALKNLVQHRAVISGNDQQLQEVTLKITQAIVQASHNSYARLLFNTLSRTTRASRVVFEMPFYFDPEAQTFFERLIEAFEQRDSDMAALLATRMFESHRENYLQAIDRLSRQNA